VRLIKENLKDYLMDSNDPWTILGVARNASDDQIKKAYRKLAMKHHPDKGGDSEEFKRIQAAYEHVTNPHEPQVFDPFSMFRDMFRQKTLHEVHMSIKSAYEGQELRFNVTEQKPCQSCVCRICGGNGTVFFSQPCPQCHGRKATGCATCTGKGVSEINSTHVLAIPAGVISGTIFHVCDSFDVKIVVDESEIFKIEGADLVYTVKMTFKESLIGTTVSVPHPGGVFEYRTKFIKPNKRYIVKGKGISPKGDLVLDFDIEYPQKLTDEQIETLSRIL
jgi:DnaJ-class molecular chaperone